MEVKNDQLLKWVRESTAARSDFDLGSVEVSGSPGFDSMIQREAHITSPMKMGRTKVASMQDLKPFIRLSAETLIHKSDRELWALKKEADGSFFIERLFDDNGDPLKG